MTNLNGDSDELVERLREEARQEEAAHKMMADAKTARQTDREDAWTDVGYDWVRAEQTTRWKAADLIERQASNHAELSERVTKLEAGLREIKQIEPDTLFTVPDRYTGERSEEAVLYPSEVHEIIDALLTDK